MIRKFSAMIMAVVWGCYAVTVAAQSPSFYTVDPFAVRPPYGAVPAVSSPALWQIDPFGVGYNLLSGYRPIYRGVQQPIGHEIITTHPNGNGYVYRPIYAPSPGYHYGPGGTVILEYPTRYPDANVAEQVVPQPSVVLPRSTRSGPREF